MNELHCNPTAREWVADATHRQDRIAFSLQHTMAVHQAPTDGGYYEDVAHFHIEFYPPNRTAQKPKYLAGSETGAGVFVMDVAPEDTARELRDKIEKDAL